MNPITRNIIVAAIIGFVLGVVADRVYLELTKIECRYNDVTDCFYPVNKKKCPGNWTYVGPCPK
jgi:hypothetical protein